MTTQTKDTMIKFKSTIRGKNSKGGDRVQLYLTREEVLTFITALQLNQGNETGVKLDIHTNVRESEDGRKFDSSFAFVKPTGVAGTTVKKTVFTPKNKKEIA